MLDLYIDVFFCLKGIIMSERIMTRKQLDELHDDIRDGDLETALKGYNGV